MPTRRRSGTPAFRPFDGGPSPSPLCFLKRCAGTRQYDRNGFYLSPLHALHRLPHQRPARALTTLDAGAPDNESIPEC